MKGNAAGNPNASRADARAMGIQQAGIEARGVGDLAAQGGVDEETHRGPQRTSNSTSPTVRPLTATSTL